MSVAIVLGAGGRAASDLEAARAVAPGASLIACNIALAKFPGADVFVTLHPEKASAWAVQARPMPEATFACDDNPHFRAREIIPDKWGGSCGLYAVQIALERLEFSHVILAGVPMSAEAESLYGRGPWGQGHVTTYRNGWAKAYPFISRRVRSVSGWTKGLLGEPSTEWLEDGPQIRRQARP